MIVGLLLSIPATASAHENGWHTWSLYKDAHLKVEAPVTIAENDVMSQRLQALDPTTATAERRYDRTVARLRDEWQRFNAAYWESLEPEPVEEPAVQEEVVPSGDIWYRLALCESGANPSTNSGNGFYGAFQFMLSTWHSVGGSGYPHEHSYATQLHFARILQASSGWGQWPGCAAQLGLL